MIRQDGVRVFCSAACVHGPLGEQQPVGAPPSRRIYHVIAAVLAVLVLLPCAHSPEPPPAPPPTVSPAAAAEPPMYGPAPPTEQELAQAFAMELAPDRWVHPLSGPVRRMPKRHSRVFGADRPGERPFECHGGHCGVDLGGEVWGEPVFAAADGVVIRVNRDPSRSGGIYVRLAHRGGAVQTHYFHLAAVPRRLREDTRVSAGDTIGLLGETGVDNSGPHLHFALSVRPGPDAQIHFIDPEPLVALWPLKVPAHAGARVDGWEAPGVPLGMAAPKRKPPRRKTRARKRRAMPRAQQPSVSAREQPAPEPAESAPDLPSEPIAPLPMAP